MNISNKQIWIFITSIIFFSTLMYINFIFAKNNYLDEKNRDLNEIYSSYISSYETINDLLIEDIISNPKTTSLLYKLKKYEDRKDIYREELYTSLLEKYHFLKSKGFNLFHFHDASGNSFLRFHKPKKYGDSLLDIRPSIRKIIKEKEIIYGIETGIFTQVFRSIYPIFQGKEYVGSVEISSPFSHLVNALNNKLKGQYTFLTKKNILDNLLNENDRNKEYTESIFGGFYISKNLQNNKFSDRSLEKFKASINHKLDLGKPFSFFSINLFSTSYVYNFLPINNIDKKFAGYLISKEKNNGISKIITTQFFTFLFLSLLLLSGILIYRKLQKQYNKNKQIFDQYMAVVDKANIVSKADSKGIITYTNEQFCKVSGYSNEELIGSSHNIIRHPDTTIPFFKQMWKTIKSKKIWHGVIKNKNKSGKDYYVKSTIAPILDEKGQVIEFIALRDDITELMKQKDMLSTEKDRMNTFLNYLDEILIIKKEDKTEQINKRFFEIFPFDNIQGFLVQHSCISELFISQEGFVSPDSDKNWREKVIESPNSLNKVLIRDKNGIIKTFWIKIQKVIYEKSFYYIYSLIDISETFLESNEKSTDLDIDQVTKHKQKKNDLFKKTKDALGLPEKVVNSLIDKFIISTQEGIENFKKAIENSEFGEAKTIAHNIKGSAGTLKFEELSFLAAQIEDKIDKGSYKKDDKDIEQIKEIIDELKYAKEIEL